jgi:hypothetical protein
MLNRVGDVKIPTWDKENSEIAIDELNDTLYNEFLCEFG